MSPWIEHVKAYAKQHNVSYRQALTDSRSTYTPVSKRKKSTPVKTSIETQTDEVEELISFFLILVYMLT